MSRVRKLMVVSAAIAGVSALVPGPASADDQAAVAAGGPVAPTLAAARNADGRMDLLGVNPVTSELFLQWQSSPGRAWAGWRLQDGKLTSIAMERNQDGRLEAVAVASNGTVYLKSQMTAGGQWRRWARMIDGVMKSVTITRRSDHRLEIFGTDLNGQVWHRRQSWPNDGNFYTDWETIDGQMSLVAAETNADGRGELFGLDATGRLWHRQQSVGDTWAPWRSLNAYFTSLAVARNADGRLEVFGSTANGQTAHMSQVSPGSLAWTAPTVVANPSDAGSLRSVTAEANADGRIDMFAADSKGEVWLRWQLWPGGQWSGWTKMAPNMKNAERNAPVPNVIGMNHNEADETVYDGPGFWSTTKTFVADPTCSRGETVSEQTPAAGQLAPVGSTIKLVVWSQSACQ